jgi:hypothetical protein
MTRKDYVMLAAAIKEAHAYAIDAARRLGVASAAHEVADAIARDNPRFDRDRFLKACGVAS